jgi:hypothetical protein
MVNRGILEMNVISCYKAAQLAQISKQAMSRQKLSNEKNKGKYPYFGYDKDSGDFGVDIEHESWIEYMETRRSTTEFDLNREKALLKNMRLVSIDRESSNSAAFDALIESCVFAVKELFSPSNKKLNQLNDLIIDNFQEKMGNGKG